MEKLLLVLRCNPEHNKTYPKNPKILKAALKDMA